MSCNLSRTRMKWKKPKMNKKFETKYTDSTEFLVEHFIAGKWQRLYRGKDMKKIKSARARHGTYSRTRVLRIYTETKTTDVTDTLDLTKP